MRTVKIDIPKNKKPEAVRLLKKAGILPDHYKEIDEFDCVCDKCSENGIALSGVQFCSECSKDVAYGNTQRCIQCAYSQDKCVMCGNSFK